MTTPKGQSTADLVSEIEAKVRAVAAPERAEHEKRYLKSELEHYGATVPELRKLTKSVLRDSLPKDHDSTVALAEELWRHPVHELRMIASFVLAERERLLDPADVPLVERLLREAGTWALVDTLSPWVIGPIVERHPEEHATLDRWSRDPDFWLRRSAVLAYQLPLRRGLPVFDRFTALADQLLEDKEFFVRKAIGWMLRERTKTYPDEVFEWLLPRKERASKVTLREAGKHLGEERIRALLG